MIHDGSHFEGGVEAAVVTIQNEEDGKEEDHILVNDLETGKKINMKNGSSGSEWKTFEDECLHSQQMFDKYWGGSKTNSMKRKMRAIRHNAHETQQVGYVA